MSPGVSLSPEGGSALVSGTVRSSALQTAAEHQDGLARLGSALQILQAPGLSSGSGSLQGRGTAPDIRSVSSRASAMKGRGCRKEGRREEDARGMMGNVVPDWEGRWLNG
ncbi:hypothetical protein NQZ68_032924 [Dissostichus eleginoides]|nr:hypothetical protein NQZ68_032924 [Dissostichus eleginoides]